jgi:hypothetical protein
MVPIENKKTNVQRRYFLLFSPPGTKHEADIRNIMLSKKIFGKEKNVKCIFSRDKTYLRILFSVCILGTLKESYCLLK